jgi:YVTN family beta-propeller protein
MHVGRALLMGLLLASVVVVALVAPGRARADGGAPNLAYIVGGGASGQDLVIIDIAQRRVIGRVPLRGDPRAVALSVDGQFAYVLQAAKRRVDIIDARSQREVGALPVGTAPQGMALDTLATGYLYVTNSGSDTMTVLDPTARQVLATIPVGKHPMGVAVASPEAGIRDPNDPEVYVANADSDTVSVISETRQQVEATIPAPGGPLSVVVPAPGGAAYVTTRAGTVLALDLAKHALLGTLFRLKGNGAGAMDYDAATGEIYVPDRLSAVVDVLQPVPANGTGVVSTVLPAEPARTLSFGGGPAAAAITFDGALGFVAERDAGRVAIFDVATYATLATLNVGGAPQAIITGAYPPVAASTPPVAPSTSRASIPGWLILAGVGAAAAAGALAYLGWSRVRRRPAKSAPGATR